MTKKIRLGLIGLGYIGRIHVLAAQSSLLCHSELPVEVEYVSLLTTNPEKNEPLARAVGISHVTSDLEAFLDPNHIDAVDICTPNNLHFHQAQAALSRGFPVYLEKPMTVNSEEAGILLELARSRKLANQVALTYRFYPAVIRAKAYIEQGIIGDVISARAHLFHSSYLNPLRPTSWRLQRDKSGGGALADLGVHMMDALLYLVGDVKSIRASVKTVVGERPAASGAPEKVPVDVDDWAMVELEFCSGAVGVLEASRVFSGRDGSFIEVFGTRGSVVVDGNDPDWPTVHVFETGTHSRGLPVTLDPLKKEILSLVPGPKMSVGPMVNSHMASLLRFGLAVQRGEVTYNGAPDFAAGYRCQVLLEAAYDSAESGGTRVNVDPNRPKAGHLRHQP